MRSLRLVLIALLLSGTIGYAQDKDSIRSNYIHSYTQYSFVGPLIKKANLDFEIISADNTDKSYTFKSNRSVGLGANINLFDVNFSFVLGIPVNVKNEQLYGKSEVADFQVSIIGRQWFADAYHQVDDGFYVQSPGINVPQGQPYPQRPDLVTKNIGMSFTYIFNHQKFSLRAPYLFSERQKVSKGSFLMSYILSKFNISADSSLVPPSEWAEWGPGAAVVQARFTSLGFAPGYSYTFVVDKFFLNLTLVFGPAHYWVKYQDQINAPRNDIRIDFYSLGRVGIGYNDDRFFSGLSFTTQSRNVTFEHTKFENAVGTVRFVVGYRFKESGIFKKRAVDFLAGN